MQKIAFILNGKTTISESMTDIFQSLAKDNIFVQSIEDGKIIINEETGEFGEIYYLTTEKTKENFEKEVSKVREDMRNAVALMQSQGLKIAPAEMKKLAEQFQFLAEENDKK